MSRKKNLNCFGESGKLIVTEPTDIEVLRAIYEQAEPGWLNWGFKRSGQVRLKEIKPPRFPWVPASSEGRLISMDLCNGDHAFSRTKALFAALARAGFEICLTLAGSDEQKNEDADQNEKTETDNARIEEIEKRLEELKGVEVTNPNDVAALRDFCDLNDLWFDKSDDPGDALGNWNLTVEEGRLVGLDCHRVSGSISLDLTPLTRLTALKELRLRKNTIRDFSPLAGMPSLEVLILARTRTVLDDLEPLAGLTSLKRLDLDFHGVCDLGPLAGLTSLRTLSLRYNEIEDLSPLAGLTGLRDLTFSCNREISDIEPLAGLTSLARLSLRGNKVRDLSPLKRMISMEILNLEDNKIKDLSPLRDMTSLRWLSAPENLIHDIGPLAGMTYMEELKLNDNRIADITSLANMTSLELLNLSRNKIKDIGPLSGLPALRSLSLHDNKIYNLESLAGKNSLEGLTLEGNRISDISPLAGLTGLYSLTLTGNRINDYTPLENIGLGNLNGGQLQLGAGLFRKVEGADPFRWYKVDVVA
jgi:internalin A